MQARYDIKERYLSQKLKYISFKISILILQDIYRNPLTENHIEKNNLNSLRNF